MSMIPPALRERPVDWLNIVQGALRAVDVEVCSSTALNALTTLSSYAAAPLSLYADVASGVKDALVYVTLLRALDVAVAAWPAPLRRHVCSPPVPRPAEDSSALAARTSGRPSGMQMDGTRPLGEAVVVLFNAAIANMDAGADDLARVCGDAARLDTANTDLTGSPASASLRVGGPITAPSVNARAAHKHFTAAQQLALAAQELLDGGDPRLYEMRLSGAEQQHLHSVLALRELLTFLETCVAVAKYVYSLFSASVACRPDALGKLAFAASACSIPATVASPSIHLLPSVLLAAYHSHRAEHCYQLDPKLPDMAYALGHIQLADAILREVEAQCMRPESAQREGRSGPQGDGESRRSPTPSTWGARLWQRLQTLSSSPDRKARARSSSASVDQRAGRAEDEDNEEPDPLLGTNCSFYTALSRYGSTRDIARVFPVFSSLLRRVYTLKTKYERENEVVYFAKAASVESVRADVPELAEGEDSTAAVPSLLTSDSWARAVAVSEHAFDGLPDPEDLSGRLTVCAETARQQTQLSAALQRVRESVEALECLQPPEEVQLSLEALLPCLEPHTGSISNAIRVAREAAVQAWAAHSQAVERWASARGKRHGLAGSDDRPTATDLVEAELQCWVQQVDDAARQWQCAVGPFDEKSTGSIVVLRQSLLPMEDTLQLFITRCQHTLDGSAVSNVQEPTHKRQRVEGSHVAVSDATATLAVLEELEAEGSVLLQRATPLYDPAVWVERVDAMKAVALAVWDAPRVVSKIEEATSALDAETIRVEATTKVRAKIAANKTAVVGTAPARASASACTRGSGSDGFHTPLDASDAEEEGRVAPTVDGAPSERRAQASRRGAGPKAAKKETRKKPKVTAMRRRIG